MEKRVESPDCYCACLRHRQHLLFACPPLSCCSPLLARMHRCTGAASRVSVTSGSALSPAVLHTSMNRSLDAETRKRWWLEYVMHTTAAACPRSLRLLVRVERSQILMAADAVTIESSSPCTSSLRAACLPTDMRQLCAPVLTFQHVTWQSAVHVYRSVPAGGH